jgi:hypothetical protein
MLRSSPGQQRGRHLPALRDRKRRRVSSTRTHAPSGIQAERSTRARALTSRRPHSVPADDHNQFQFVLIGAAGALAGRRLRIHRGAGKYAQGGQQQCLKQSDHNRSSRKQ